MNERLLRILRHMVAELLDTDRHYGEHMTYYLVYVGTTPLDKRPALSMASDTEYVILVVEATGAGFAGYNEYPCEDIAREAWQNYVDDDPTPARRPQLTLVK